MWLKKTNDNVTEPTQPIAELPYDHHTASHCYCVNDKRNAKFRHFGIASPCLSHQQRGYVHRNIFFPRILKVSINKTIKQHQIIGMFACSFEVFVK